MDGHDFEEPWKNDCGAEAKIRTREAETRKVCAGCTRDISPPLPYPLEAANFAE